MRIAITGASGLVGGALRTLLARRGHQVAAPRRGAGESTWDVETGAIHVPGGIDALVHLAGRNVATHWTTRVKREIWESRVTATKKLCAFLAEMPPETRPRVLIAASAIGIYGDRGDELLTEESPVEQRKGESFLADVCRGWEEATVAAERVGIRVVHARLGVVLAKEGGALAALLTPTKLFLGGPVGSGTQFLSWISLPDVVAMLAAAVEDDSFRGVMNAVAGTVRQHAFMRTLGGVLHRPTLFPMPGLVVRAIFGRMGREVLLSSQRVACTRSPAGFVPRDLTLQAAMRRVLDKNA